MAKVFIPVGCLSPFQEELAQTESLQVHLWYLLSAQMVTPATQQPLSGKCKVVPVHARNTYGVELQQHSFLISAGGRKVSAVSAGYFTPAECIPWCPLNKGLGGPHCSALGPLHYQKTLWSVILCNLSDTSRFFFILLLKIITLYYIAFRTCVKMNVCLPEMSHMYVYMNHTHFVFYTC